MFKVKVGRFVLTSALVVAGSLHANDLEVWVGGPVLMMNQGGKLWAFLAQTPQGYVRPHRARVYFEPSQVTGSPNAALGDLCHGPSGLKYLEIPDRYEVDFEATKWVSSGPPQRVSSCATLPDPSFHQPGCTQSLAEREADAKWLLDFQKIANAQKPPLPIPTDLPDPQRLAARVRFDRGELEAGDLFKCGCEYWTFTIDGVPSPMSPQAAAEYAVVRLASASKEPIQLRWRPIGDSAAPITILAFTDSARVFVVLDLENKGNDHMECHPLTNEDHKFIEALLASASQLRMPTGKAPAGCLEPRTPRSNCSPVLLW